MKIPDFKTLEEAKQFLRDHWEEGTNCPCCKQRVQLYKLKINGIATSDLIRLFKLVRGQTHQYKHVGDFSIDRGGAFAKLAHWGLVQPELNEDTSKRTSGMWCITEKGKDFVMNKITVPQKVALYNKKAWGFSENHVDIKKALGTKFNYEELMGFKQNA